MAFVIKHVNLLEEPAEALIYSTNVALHLTGGVGAQLRERFGWDLQLQLTGQLRGRNFAQRGEIFECTLPDMPWKVVFHTCPTDGFYDTTRDIVEAVLRRCLDRCSQLNLHTVTTSALATGYGHLLFRDFIKLYGKLAADPSYQSLQRVTLCLHNRVSFEQAAEHVAAMKLTDLHVIAA